MSELARVPGFERLDANELAQLEALTTLTRIHQELNPYEASSEGYPALVTAIAGLEKVAGVRRHSAGLEHFTGMSTRIEGLNVSAEGAAQTFREYALKLMRWLKHIAELVIGDIESCFSGASAVASDEIGRAHV